jgi:cytochrome oxidase Cu insertion factor (SCO1/SenC/PrrC family)
MSAVAKIWIVILLGAVTAYGIHTAVRLNQASEVDPTPIKVVELTPDPQPLPELDKVELIERSGANFHFADMQGKVWVANMFYSTCQKECLQLMQTVRSLQHQYKNVQFVSITCDPDRDTPARLREYAATLTPDGDRWSFLTGDMSEIGKASKPLFGFTVAREQHTQYLTLVDEQGRFVKMFHGLAPDGVSELTQTLDAMANKAAAQPSAHPTAQSTAPSPASVLAKPAAVVSTARVH